VEVVGAFLVEVGIVEDVLGIAAEDVHLGLETVGVVHLVEAFEIADLAFEEFLPAFEVADLLDLVVLVEVVLEIVGEEPLEDLFETAEVAFEVEVDMDILEDRHNLEVASFEAEFAFENN